MRKIKLLFGATILGVVAMSMVVVSGALAEPGEPTHIESCMTGGTECKPATVGTLLYTTGTLELSNGAFTSKCEAELEIEVTDNEMIEEKGESEMAGAEILSSKYSKCSKGEVSATKRWLFLLSYYLWWYSQFVKLTELWSFVEVSVNLGEAEPCVFGEGTANHVKATWTNGEPSSSKIEGSLSRVKGPVGCESTVKVGGSFKVTSVSDPELKEATNIKTL